MRYVDLMQGGSSRIVNALPTRLHNPRGSTCIVEILYFAGCPGFEEVVPRVRDLARDAGAHVVLRAVETLEAAEAEQFLGSPTIRVDGRDVDPTAAGRTDFGLKCRLYRHGADHRRVPPEAWIRAALEGHHA